MDARLAARGGPKPMPRCACERCLARRRCEGGAAAGMATSVARRLASVARGDECLCDAWLVCTPPRQRACADEQVHRNRLAVSWMEDALYVLIDTPSSMVIYSRPCEGRQVQAAEDRQGGGAVPPGCHSKASATCATIREPFAWAPREL
jgi:hypothetical protein